MKKDIPIIFAAILIAVLLIKGTDFQTVDEYYLTHIDDITPDSQVVTLSIDCSSAVKSDKLDKGLKESGKLPENGVILPETEYVLREGDTAFDILDRAARHNKIQMEYQGADKNSYKSVYIKGIDYLYEFSCGENSGWLYTVNGKSPNVGCSDYKLKDGDNIEWKYVCDFENS